MWQRFVEQIYQLHVSRSFCSLGVSLSHFFNSHNIPKFFIITILYYIFKGLARSLTLLKRKLYFILKQTIKRDFFCCKQTLLATHFYSFLKEWEVTSFTQYSFVSSGMIMLCIISASCLSSDNQALCFFTIQKKIMFLWNSSISS